MNKPPRPSKGGVEEAMMTCKKRGSKWVLLSKTDKRVLGTHSSKAACERQDRAINISKARAAGHRIPRKAAKR